MLITPEQLRIHLNPLPTGVQHLQQAATLNGQLRLVIRQIQLGLPVTPLLAANPPLAKLVQQLQAALPNLADQQFSRRKIWLHYPMTAILAHHPPTPFQANVNLGWKQHKPLLFEWGLRTVKLTWTDRLKLWATAEHLRVSPIDCRLVVIKLGESPGRQLYRWDAQAHEHIKQWTCTLLHNASGPPPAPKPLKHNNDGDWLQEILKNIDRVPEVTL